MEQTKFTYSLLGKALEKQAEKQVDTLNFVNLSNEIDELKQIESIFSKKQLHHLIIEQLKKIIKLQNNLKLDDLEHTKNRGKHYNFSKYSLPIIFLRNIHKENLPLEDAIKEQSQLINKFKGMGKGNITVEKRSFIKNSRLCLGEKRSFLVTLKAKYLY